MTADSSFRHIFITKTFERSAKRAAKQSSDFSEQLRATLQLLQANMFDAGLRSHKLKGDLHGCWACRVNYSMRIVFEVGEPRTIAGVTAETLVLLSVGTHDEVY